MKPYFQILWPLLIVLLAGCQNHRMGLVEDLQVEGQFEYEKYPISVTLVEDKEISLDRELHYFFHPLKDGGLQVYVELQPGLNHLFQKGLGILFEKVDLVPEKNLKKAKSDLIVYPSIEGGGKLDQKPAVRVVLKGVHRKTGKVMFTIEDSQLMPYPKPSTTTDRLYLATMFSAYILSPITIPAIRRHRAKETVQTLEKLLIQSMIRLRDKLIEDENFAFYVEKKKDEREKEEKARLYQIKAP